MRVAISACGFSFIEWHFAWAPGRVPSCEKSYPRRVGSISACGLGEKWQYAVDSETNGDSYFCQNIIFPVFVCTLAI